MASAEEELQAAVDRGELQSKNAAAIKRQFDATERRWIVMQVKDIAVAHALTPEQFKELCDYIKKFVQVEAGA